MNDHTRKSIGLGSSPMFDSVEIVRDGKIVKSIPADSAQIGCYPSCQGAGHAPECPNAAPRIVARDTAQDVRDPTVILSGIWSLANVIAEIPDEVISHYGDRIGELCAELEAALLQSQLRGSIKEKL